MRKSICIAIIISLILSSLMGCGAPEKPYSASITPALTITGDVGNVITIKSYEGFTASKIQYNGSSVTALPFRQLMEKAGQVQDDAIIYFTATDGIISGIPAGELKDGCYLYLGGENGWQFISDKHPPQSGVKNIDKIVVCAKSLQNEQKCLRIIADDKIITLSYGQLFMEDAVSYAVHEGDPQKNNNNVSVNTRRYLIPISKYADKLGKSTEKTALAYFYGGRQQQIDLNGYIEWRGNSCDYIGADKISRIPDLIGIWINPPAKSITDVAPDALDSLKDGRVMIIELDGLSYYVLVSVSPDFMSGYNITPARTVMPCVSSVALASLVTGLTTDKNGVVREGIRQYNSGIEDVFSMAKKEGKTSSVVEGDSRLIDMSIDQQLNPDGNKNGSTDDEVFATSQKTIAAGNDLTFIHFHGYDDIAHTFGPMSDKAQAKLRELDNYIAELCKSFSGTVIITADHGQYGVNLSGKLGEHGEFRPLSMTIPYIKFKVAK